MNYDTLPAEFAYLAGKVNHVQRVNSTEWSSSCPQCGGEAHRGGDLPDRFRMWTNANGKNKVMGWCRRCSYVSFPTHEKPLSKDEFDAWRREQILVETRKKEEAERALSLLKSQKIWETYHSELNTWSMEVLRSWGITSAGAAYWRLGLIKDYVVFPENYHSPAISIPSWGFGWEAKNVKVRVLNPKSDKDRYRSLYKIGKGVSFVARPDLKSDVCLLVEGEKKAMVAAVQDENLQVIGVPTKTPGADTLKDFDGFGKIFVCLDSDARIKAKNGVSPLRRLLELLDRKRCAVIHLPGKLDDMILKHNLNLGAAMRYAK